MLDIKVIEEDLTYEDFLKNKTTYDYNKGFNIDISGINSVLFDWQKAVVRWAVKKGTCALYEDCGLGKTFQQIEWLRIILEKSGGKGLIVCPLSVAEQTEKEAEKLGINIDYIITDEENTGITNYERLDRFNGVEYKAVVLDESSILKSVSGKIKAKIIEMFNPVPYKLSCTATPSPNDISELGNQVEFLNIMSRSEMLSKFFVNDAKAGEWRLKGHAKHDFYKWMASWSVFIRKPSDIGFSDEGYNLSELKIHPVYVDCEFTPDGELFPTTDIKGIQGRTQVRKQTIDDKVKMCSCMANKDHDQWLIFCGLNEESDKTSKALNNCINVQGSDSPEFKNKSFWKFKKGEIKDLVTKGKIAGFGMNFQNSHKMGFIGLGDSFELYYQCIRREYRFGQKHPVDVFLFLTNAEQAIYRNVMRKEEETNKLFEEVVKEMQDFTKQEIETGTIQAKDEYSEDYAEGENWEAYKGDVIETIHKVKNESVDMQVFSPPFFSLYTYSPSSRDMGNNNNDKEFWKHFDYLIPHLYNKLKPGCICAVHCMDIPATIVKDGYIGLKDLRGDIIRHFQKHGYIYDGCAFIPKNPQAQSIRTHSKGLTFTQFEKDSSWSRPALPDYLIKFRKPGNREIPVQNGDGGEISRDDWIGLASGNWTPDKEFEIKQEEWEYLNLGWWETVRETYTLNTIKHDGDEKHMCPLQLDTIHNAIRLWSNPGEIVEDPFGGIGSTGYQCILDNRKAVLHELKPEYFQQLIKNMNEANKIKHEGELF